MPIGRVSRVELQHTSTASVRQSLSVRAVWDSLVVDTRRIRRAVQVGSLFSCLVRRIRLPLGKMAVAVRVKVRSQGDFAAFCEGKANARDFWTGRRAEEREAAGVGVGVTAGCGQARERLTSGEEMARRDRRHRGMNFERKSAIESTAN